jgi:hypothetical protein
VGLWRVCSGRRNEVSACVELETTSCGVTLAQSLNVVLMQWTGMSGDVGSAGNETENGLNHPRR